jgi:hypothetical protein
MWVSYLREFARKSQLGAARRPGPTGVPDHAPVALAGGHATSGTALDQGGELLPRLRQRGVHVGSLRASKIMSWRRPAECAVEHLLDGTQGDPIVLRTDQETEAGERSIEKLGLGRSQVFEVRAVELLTQLLAPAIFSARACPPRARSSGVKAWAGAPFLSGRDSLERVGSPLGSRRLCELDSMLLIVGVCASGRCSGKKRICSTS